MPIEEALPSALDQRLLSSSLVDGVYPGAKCSMNDATMGRIEDARSCFGSSSSSSRLFSGARKLKCPG